MAPNIFEMPSSQPPTPEPPVTPSEFLEVINLGTEKNFNHRACVEFLKRKGKRGRFIIKQTRETIVELTGFEMSELVDNATKRTSMPSDTYRSTQESIRRQLREMLPFAQEHLGSEANNYIKEIIDSYFPGEGSLKIRDEIKICNDAAELVLKAFSNKIDAIVQHQAGVKLLVMKFLGEIKNSSKVADAALNYMMKIFNNRIFEVPEGEKEGWETQRYLVAWHEPDTYKTIETVIFEERPTDIEILEARPTSIDESNPVTITEIPSRKTTVEDKAGNSREIYSGLELREKSPNSLLTKTLRYRSLLGEKDYDKNGIRELFDCREDWDDFFRFYKATIQKHGLEELCEMHEDSINEIEEGEILERINGIEDSIKIYDEQDTLDGREFNGNAASSSKKLKVHKFRMNINAADGTNHQLEYQVFLPDGYADEKYRKGMSQPEYHADRFFREGVDELLFPKKRYPTVDRKKAYAKAMVKAHLQALNNSVQTAMPPPPATP